MERVGQSGLKNLFMITKAAEGGRSEASVVAVGIRVLSLPCVKFVPVIFLAVYWRVGWLGHEWVCVPL